MKLSKMTDAEVLAGFGKQGDNKNFTTITLPYPMVVAWDKKVSITKVMCHKKIAEPLLNVFKDLLCVYGLPKIKELGIDLFGGLYNFRLMRGSKTRWSRHSWAIAIDLDPERNKLKETKKTARFARPEYKLMIDVFYKHGFISYGVESDFDWMHFEFGIEK